MTRVAHGYWVHSQPDDGWSPCAQGEWCLAAAITRDPDGNLIRDPAPTPRAFCDADESRIRRELAELAAQYAHLAAEMRRHGPVPRFAARFPAGSKVLIRLDCDALMRLMAEILISWHERVAFAASLHFPPAGDDAGNLLRRRDSKAVSDAVTVLKEHVPTLLGLPAEPVRRAVDLRDVADLPDDTAGIVHAVYAETSLDLSGADAGLEILRLRYLCRAILGETRDKPEELLGVPCRDPECDMLTLRRAEPPSDPAVPASWSECSACGDKMSEEEYRDWTKLYARWAQGRQAPALENLPGVA